MTRPTTLALSLICFSALLASAEQKRGAVASAPDPNVLAAEDYLQKHEYQKALEALELVVRLGAPKDPEIFVMMAVAQLNLENKTGAIQSCERGLDAFPSSARLAAYYSQLLEQTFSSGELAAALDRALSRWPKNPVLRKNLGRALLDARTDPERAGPVLAQARTELPRDPEVHYLFGRWACLQQKEAECVEALTRSLSLTPPTNFPALLVTNGTMAIAEERRGRLQEARAAFESAMAAWRRMPDPVPAEPVYEYVRYLLDRNDKVAARRVNAEIIARCPRFPPSHLEEGRFLFADGKHEDAAQQAEVALASTNPVDRIQTRAIRSFLVKVYSRLGRKDEARQNQEWVEANQ